MDFATLAATTIGSLLVPYLKKGADKLAEAIGEKLGEDAAGQLASSAKNAWDLVKGAFTADTEIITLGLFEKNPEMFQEPMRQMLENNLSKNPVLAEKLDTLLNAPSPAGTTTTSIIQNATNAGVLNMQGASVSNATGNIFAGVNVGGNPVPKT